MFIKRGQIVFVTAGKEKGRFMIVLEADDRSVLLCDGKDRPCDRPKRKNIKYVSVTDTVVSEADLAANSRIKSVLRSFTA